MQSYKTLHKETVKNMKRIWKKCNLALYLGDLWALVSRTNKYIDETQPWVLAKDEDKQGQLGFSNDSFSRKSSSNCGICSAIYDEQPKTNG